MQLAVHLSKSNPRPPTPNKPNPTNHPQQVDVHNNLGDLWRAQGAAGRAAAQQCYAEALRLDPGYAPAWRGLGDLAREWGDQGQSLACYQEAVRLRPG